MSNSVASESIEGHESREISRKRGAGDEEKEDEDKNISIPSAESLTISTTVSTVPATTDQFMFTDDFKMLLVGFVQGDTLMTLRLVSQAWKRVADAFIDEGVRNGELMVHGSRVVQWPTEAKKERLKLVTRVIFLLNITKVRKNACHSAGNLVVVDIPETVTSIGRAAFPSCRSLTTVSFSTTLKSIGPRAFAACTNLENVDLLNTNLQELGQAAFRACSELTSITIPDSLQTLGRNAFSYCSKLVPSNIDVSYPNDATSEIVAYLRIQQRIASLEKMVAALTTENAAQATEIVALQATQAVENATLTTENTELKELSIGALLDTDGDSD